jgi:light-harvesting protein B-800-850 alpha chain
MWYGRIWLVVKPSVGLPLFLAGVAITSLLVHAAILTHTTWMSAYWQGGTKMKVASASAPESTAPVSVSSPSVTINVNK